MRPVRHLPARPICGHSLPHQGFPEADVHSSIAIARVGPCKRSGCTARIGTFLPFPDDLSNGRSRQKPTFVAVDHLDPDRSGIERERDNLVQQRAGTLNAESLTAVESGQPIKWDERNGDED